jgi:hypothetical protein
MKAISELERDDEWYERVNYIIIQHKSFGEKLKAHLERKIS